VYVARNPKDVAVSYYHHYCHMLCYKGNKDNFVEGFANDLTLYSPINSHILEFWKIRDEPNILFLFFEDMKKNLEGAVKKVIDFFDKSYTQEEIDKLCKHLSFDSMKQNKMINMDSLLVTMKKAAGETNSDDNGFSFIRKGQIGSFKKELSGEQNKMLDDYCNDPKFKNFKFAYRFRQF
jgi:uncharacterized protein YdiU (UPF0061 family)